MFPLHPETPETGLSLEALFRGRNLDLDAMHASMKQRMDAEGLPYAKRNMTYNSRLAQELAKWADSKGAHAIHDALYRAYFVDGRNISDPAALVAIAESVGLDGGEAARSLEARTFSDAVDADWSKARHLGITGVPTFVIGDQGVVGAQPYEVLEELVRRAGSQPLVLDPPDRV